ncbi:MAG: dipeptide epimerase [Bacteroidales bacterium]|nr:dipeptide epimerase [Bacteroidales bacterium]MDD2424990.1 dipeptide epimerase [Bacteroidales bacterium]MDD3989540.1 dipeptide epimerase [Bacteroidales bacterium]MDD4639344.1 dipeptide epimerase [Bacteroidales bacterium]
MKNISRRKFLRSSAIIAATGALVTPNVACKRLFVNTKTSGSKTLSLKFSHMMHELRHTFTISGFSRDQTAAVLAEISYDGYTGYGEGGLPPYMTGQTVESSTFFLNKIDLSQFSSPFELEDILTYVDSVDSGHSCSKSAIDIALHDLIGKLLDKPLYQLWGYNREKAPDTSFTIGIDKEEVVRQKTEEAAPYNLIKVKLGVDEKTDKMLVNTIRSVTDKPIVVDANQGWKDKNFALEMINWLNERNVLLIEQPMPKNVFDEMAWVTERSPLPTFADESCQRLADVAKLHNVFSGINIKLIKCTGLREANKMIATADALGMKLMIGCTTESSCAISAAAQISPKMYFADLDGNLLISNDPFTGMKIVDGKITLNDKPGIGISRI